MSIYEPLKIFDPEGRIHVAPDRIRYFTDICRGKVVLHVGCADWPITKERLRDGRLLHAALSGVCQQLVGTDISNDGLAMLKSAGFRDLVNVPAERMTLDTFGHTFDVVLAGDVLEHMTNPGTLIENARDLLSPGGQLVIGAPSALTLINFRAWLLRRELVHKDHCFYFSPKTLACLCSRYGWVPTRLTFTMQALARGKSRVFGAVRHLIVKLCPPCAPSFIMTFQRRESVTPAEYFLWK